jgi:RND family efflux transporter MFP subunit
MTSLKRMLRGLGYLAIFSIIAGGGYLFWQNQKAKVEARKAELAKLAAAPSAPAISVVKVAVADFVETVMVSGSLVPREDTIVSPEIEGYRVLELFADEGSEVKKGQVLARLVPDQLEAQAAQNDANLSNAMAGIARAESLIKDAQARQEEAKSQLERAVPLRKSGYLSESVFDQRESAARQADAQVRAAKDALTAAQAQKTQVEAQRRELEWRRGKTEVTSPVDGVVSRRNARIGAVASAVGDPMFRIIQNGEMELDAEIVETELYKVKPGQKARITVPGATDVEGQVRLVSPEIDKTTRLGRVRVFLGRNPALLVGAFARGVIETNHSRGISVPPASVMFDTSGSYVLVVSGDKVARKNVGTGLVADGRVEIKSGLSEGDLIVEQAGTFLRDGDVIRPVVENDKTAEVR